MTATPPPPAAPDLEEGRRLWDRLQSTLAAKTEAEKRTPTRVTREDLDHIDASDAFRKYVAANFPALLSRLSALEQEAERLREELADLKADRGDLLAVIKRAGDRVASDRDELGAAVRVAWVEWARTQPSPKPSWLVPYSQLSEADKEADRQIGEYVWRLAAAHFLSSSQGGRE